MEQEVTLPEFHRTIAGWKDEVNTVREDLTSLMEHLEKIIGSNTKHEILAHVEHFQNQFIRHKEVADELFHDLKQASKRLTKENEKDNKLNNDLTDRMHTFKRLFKALKSDFDRFIEKSS